MITRPHHCDRVRSLQISRNNGRAPETVDFHFDVSFDQIFAEPNGSCMANRYTLIDFVFPPLPLRPPAPLSAVLAVCPSLPPPNVVHLESSALYQGMTDVDKDVGRPRHKVCID